MRELEKTHKAQEELKKQSAAIKSSVTQQAAGTADAAGVSLIADAKELENCKKEVSALTEQLKEKSKLLEDLQIKLEGVEKEYLILYQKHVKTPG